MYPGFGHAMPFVLPLASPQLYTQQGLFSICCSVSRIPFFYQLDYLSTLLLHHRPHQALLHPPPLLHHLCTRCISAVTIFMGFDHN